MANRDNDEFANDDFASADSDQEDPTVAAISAERREHTSTDSVKLPAESNLSGKPAPVSPAVGAEEEPKGEYQIHAEKPTTEKNSEAGATKVAPEPAKPWGWGGWGGFWSSVSTVTETAQALGHRVMTSMEDTLGLPTNDEVTGIEKEDETTKKLAEEAVEHDVCAENELVQMEPTATPTGAVPGLQMDHGEQELDREEQELDTEDQHSALTGLTGFLSGFAAAVQTTGKGIVAGGLDALELLGKKTIDVISEGDKGLLKKRALIGVETAPTLSQLLREAKAASDKVATSGELEGTEKHPVTYSLLFDEYQGCVHLEALELLSRECEGKVEFTLSGLSPEELAKVQDILHNIVDAFSLEELQGSEDPSDSGDDNTKGLLQVLELFSDVGLPLKVDRVTKVSSKWRTKLEVEGPKQRQDNKEDAKDGEAEGGNQTGTSNDASKEKLVLVVYEDGLRSLAELTSASVELFRKMAELVLLPQGQEQDLLVQAKRFNRLTHMVSVELESLAAKHAESITKLDPQDCHSSTTSLYLEASNSCSYVQDAFQLLCPVLKFSALQKTRSLPVN